MSNLSNTQSQVLPHTHDESEITWLSTDLQWKQDKLVAWSNISIAADGKTISATDTKYSAWTNVTIDANNKISATDTTYNDATQSVHWLMSAADKLKLDGIEPWAWVAKVSWVKWDAESSYREWLVNITKANIGLWNVDDTSDANKPVSTAMQTALDLKQDISSMPTDLWDFTNNAWFIKNTVNDLTNYYKKTETYTQTEINNLINSFWGFQVVSTLPTSDIKTNIIYLLWPIWTWADKYEEWIYTTTWVKIGETSVDLTNYVTTNTAQTISAVKTFSAEPVLPSKTTDATNSWTAIATEAQVYKKQDTLVSWTNIKTINNTSLLWSGNIDIQIGGNYTAGNWIDITNDEIWLDGTYEWKDYSAMQWPAPDGFHVPLNTERKAVRDIRTALGGWSSDWTKFWIALKLPFAGSRYYSSAGVDSQGIYGYYWSSSRSSTNNAYVLSFNSTALNPQNVKYRAYGFSVRCFKNSPVVPTSSWTKLYWTSIEAGWIFWSSTDWLISLSSDWTTWITIADKNLWATTVWNSWNTLSEANCWKYYQRWNNYWFPFTWSVTTSSTQVDASSYWPWNYYSSSTFITWSDDRSSVHNNNLWWWVTWIQTVSWNLVLWDKLYKIVTSATAPASWTASNVITIVTD